MRILRSACFVTHTQQQGTTAWAAVDVTLTAGKPSLLDLLVIAREMREN